MNRVFEVKSELFEWRGPSPFHFVAINDEDSALIKTVAKDFTYGWGVLYATIQIGSLVWTTALIPKEGQYLIPFRDEIRKKLKINLGEIVKCKVRLGKTSQTA